VFILSFPGFIGIKRGMSQTFDEQGNVIPVTVVELLSLTVTQIKNADSDGYAAIQVGVVPAKEKHLTKPRIGHFTSKNLPLFRLIKEYRVQGKDVLSYTLGQTIDVSFLSSVKALRISSVSKGKGTMGNIRRWGHHRGPMSHGSKSHRLPGSIGAGTTPGRVFKGLPMAGRTGNNLNTFSQVKVVQYLEDKGVLLLKGSIAGAKGAVVYGKV
jgi:large subunit ribosomal protein L3